MDNSLFWSIYRPDSPDRTSVIFGTMHIGVSNGLLLDKIDRLIKKFHFVFTETSLDKVYNSYMMKTITLSEGNEWSVHLGQKTFKKIKNIFIKAYGVDVGMYQGFRPLIIMGLFYESFNNKGVKSAKLDEHIWQFAESNSCMVRGIESIEEQSRIMQNIPLEYDFNLIKKWGRNITLMNRQLSKLIEVYNQEDINELYKRSIKSLGKLKALMLYHRNVVMADRIATWHDEAPSLFTFGAGHMAGKKGVLTLLKKKGFVIKPYDESNLKYQL